MSVLGELLGYDENGDDLLGTNRDEGMNCPACGQSARLHTPIQEAQCLGQIFGTDDSGKSAR